MAMAMNTDNTTSPQPSVAHDSPDSTTNSTNVASTIGDLFAQDNEIGDWSDLQDTDIVADLPERHYPAAEETPRVVFAHDLGIVLGQEVMRCQLPDHPPFHALVFDLPDLLDKEELYMLFGGKRAIESFLFRRDLREVIIKFRKYEHISDAFLKQNMVFKNKPISLALILMDSQIRNFHRHCQTHHDLDDKMVPFAGAFNLCYERLEDGSLAQLFDDVSADSDTMSSVSVANSTKKSNSNDVRLNSQFPPSSGGSAFPRSRADSTNSVTSLRSMMSEQSTNRSSHHSPPESEHITRQSISRQSSISVDKPKLNPFGDAKPVNTREKELMMQEQIQSQRQNLDSEPGSQGLPDLTQPPPLPHHKFNNAEPGSIKIQKRPPDAPSPNAQQNSMQWVNSNLQRQEQEPQPPQQIPAPQFRPVNPNHIQIHGEVIDTSKPPPVIKGDYKPRGGKHPNPRYYKEGHYNGVNSHSQYDHHGSYHSNLPPAGPTKGYRGQDERKKFGSAKMEKSKSVPVDANPPVNQHQQLSRKNSPTDGSAKRPNSANSSKSFVTASEMSSNPSSEIPGAPGSMESINESSDGTDEYRRHSWERRNKEVGRKSYVKNRKKSNTATDLTQTNTADNGSRRSSTSTPQYQSASNIFIEGEVLQSNAPALNIASRSFNQKLPHHIKIKREGRAPSLPLSRPHTASNETESSSRKLDFDDKPDSLSAPPTPSGSTKKKADSRKKRGTKQSTALHGNKFRALADAQE